MTPRLKSRHRRRDFHCWQGSISLQEQRVREQFLTGELDAANRQLELLATTDAPSGLANHRRFNMHLEQEWSSCVRDEAAVSLVGIEVTALGRLLEHGSNETVTALEFSLGMGCVRPTRSAQPSALSSQAKSALAEGRRLRPGRIVRCNEDGVVADVSSTEAIE